MENKRLKVLEDLCDIHRGKEIWIIGAGKSLDDFPKDFFDDKIAIAINGAILKYPRATYFCAFHSVWINMAIKSKGLLEKSLFQYIKKTPNTETRTLEDMGLENIPFWICVNTFQHYGEDTKKAIEGVAFQIYNKSKNIEYMEHGTTAHVAMWAAFVMGANSITLVGCEHKSYPNQNRYANIGIPYPNHDTRVWSKNINPEINKVTKLIADEISEYNVKVSRYFNADSEYYKKGYVSVS